ncbi:hypothetical protein NL676_003087 [Syzygium grande]|nr:hypothetical protein NL676_003087 [Syzygium grande]
MDLLLYVGVGAARAQRKVAPEHELAHVLMKFLIWKRFEIWSSSPFPLFAIWRQFVKELENECALPSHPRPDIAGPSAVGLVQDMICPPSEKGRETEMFCTNLIRPTIRML